MKKTDTSDVYILNIVEPVDKNGKVFMKRKKIGLAYIPNMERSKWCKDVSDDREDGILVNCKFHTDKMKWEPIEIAKTKRPSFITDFDVKEL